MKRLITWAYKRWVNQIYLPTFTSFAISYKHKQQGVIWDSSLPDVLVLRVKDTAGKWQDVTLER